MKARHYSGYRLNARALLANINASVGQDFHTLSSSQVEMLLAAADHDPQRLTSNFVHNRERIMRDTRQDGLKTGCRWIDRLTYDEQWEAYHYWQKAKREMGETPVLNFAEWTQMEGEIEQGLRL